MKKNFKKIISLALVMLLMLSTFGVVGSAQTADYTRIVTVVNGDTRSSRGISWFTESKNDSVVTVYENGTDVTADVKIDKAEVVKSNGLYSHKVTLSNLDSGKTYTYRVGDGKTFSDEYSFTTDNGDNVVKYITTGDPQASSVENFEKAARTLTKAFETVPDADFYAINGDFTNDSTNEEWNNYFTTFSSINSKTTLVPVTGNHDSDANWFNSMFNLDTSEATETKDGVNYSFEYGNVHIAVLNTNDCLAISKAQLNWLRNDMNSTSCDWKIVQMHKSPYTLGKDGKWPDALSLQKTLTAVCDETNVDLVISGHDHMYLRTKPLTANKVNGDGTTYILGGTCGTKRYEIRKFSIDAFMPKSLIDANVVQKNGYANQYNGTDWNETDPANVGGCFESVEVNGGTLTVKAYIVSDENDSVKNIDTLVLTKETGKNVPTFTGKNDTNKEKTFFDKLGSYMDLLMYCFTSWLPKFLKALPSIISTYIKEGTF